MSREGFTKQEMSELEDAGVRYPWNPLDTLRYVRECKKLENKLSGLEKENYQLKCVIKALEIVMNIKV